jgi:hypothetical protein
LRPARRSGFVEVTNSTFTPPSTLPRSFTSTQACLFHLLPGDLLARVLVAPEAFFDLVDLDRRCGDVEDERLRADDRPDFALRDRPVPRELVQDALQVVPGKVLGKLDLPARWNLQGAERLDMR